MKKKFTFNNKNFEVELRDQADESVFAEIFKHREYKIADEAIVNTEIILDIGAHSGLFSIYSFALNSSAKIFAIEPEENNFQLLKTHLEENNINTAEPIQAAIAGQTGYGTLEISADSHNHVLTHEVSENSQKVKTYNFKDFCNQYKLKNISLVKMDIEGGEYEIFSQMMPEDFTMIKNIMMEYHNYDGRSYKEIENILRENGFGVQIFPSKFDKQMGFLFANNKRKYE